MHVNTSPGICTTHHLIETLFSYIPVKNIFLTNSVETRTDPDQLVCQKPAGLNLFHFYDKISVKNTQSGSAALGVLAVVSLKLLEI